MIPQGHCCSILGLESNPVGREEWWNIWRKVRTRFHVLQMQYACSVSSSARRCGKEIWWYHGSVGAGAFRGVTIIKYHHSEFSAFDNPKWHEFDVREGFQYRENKSGFTSSVDWFAAYAVLRWLVSQPPRAITRDLHRHDSTCLYRVLFTRPLLP